MKLVSISEAAAISKCGRKKNFFYIFCLLYPLQKWGRCLLLIKPKWAWSSEKIICQTKKVFFPFVVLCVQNKNNNVRHEFNIWSVLNSIIKSEYIFGYIACVMSICLLDAWVSCVLLTQCHINTAKNKLELQWKKKKIFKNCVYKSF